MLNSILATDTAAAFTAAQFAACTAVSILLGLAIMAFYSYKNPAARSFRTALALLPVIVQVVIMVVNGNVGTGVAVMGAFSLIRFRSAPGTARDICAIFLAMSVGLACGAGYLGMATIVVAIVAILNFIFLQFHLVQDESRIKRLVITIPESLDYSEVFDDLFERYNEMSELVSVRTTNMGSLFQLDYNIIMKDNKEEKAFLDDLRCRNGNLEIYCGQVPASKKEKL